MKYLSHVVSDTVISNQIPLPDGMTADQVIAVSEFLRSCKLLEDDEEIAITDVV